MAAGATLVLALGDSADVATPAAGRLTLGVDTTGGLFTKDSSGTVEFLGIEGIEDTVGAMFVDTATIDFTYNDGLGQITADLKDGSVTTPKMGLTAGTLTFPDALNVALGTATGSQLGTGATQKLGFYGATPVAQIAGGTDLLAGLVTQGLRAASSNPPLDLGTGALTAGTTGVGAFSATSITATGTVALTDTLTVTDGKNFVIGTGTGTQIGTGTTQKIGFYGTAPTAQIGGGVDVLAGLVTLGLRAASSNPPLNLGTGAMTAGTTNVGALTASSVAGTGTVALTGNMTVTDGVNIVLGTVTGTKIGTGTTQLLGFYNATPVAQIAGNTDVLAGLVTLGLRAASSNPPLNLGSGAITSGGITASGTVVINGGGAPQIQAFQSGADFYIQQNGAGAADMYVRSQTGKLNLGNSAGNLQWSNVGPSLVFPDAATIAVGTSTGTKIGTATTQKLGFFGATPVVQEAGSNDVLASLVTLGLRAASSNPPLNLGTGAVTAASLMSPAAQILTVGSTGGNNVVLQTNSATRVTIGGTTGNLTFAALNFIFDTTTGTQIGTATTQKIGFWGKTPIVQPTRVGPIVDNSGGTSTSPTIPAVAAASVDATAASLTTTRNAVASLAAAIAAIETRLSAAGGGSGLTA